MGGIDIGGVMGMRVGPLGLLLVLALGSGAMAQSPSPEASPLLAPDDLTIVLPEQVGDWVMTHESWTGSHTLATSDERQRMEWLEVLAGLDREPTDLAFAVARPEDSPDGEGYVILAMRVDGVAADALMDRYLRVHKAVAGQPVPDDWVLPSQTIDGRTIYELTGGPYPVAFMYPVGEVVFNVIGEGAVAVDEVLAELP